MISCQFIKKTAEMSRLPVKKCTLHLKMQIFHIQFKYISKVFFAVFINFNCGNISFKNYSLLKNWFLCEAIFRGF